MQMVHTVNSGCYTQFVNLKVPLIELQCVFCEFGIDFFILLEEIESNSQIELKVKVLVFSGDLLARSQFISDRTCDPSTRSRIAVVFFGLRVNA
jgi:hypothetical protein